MRIPARTTFLIGWFLATVPTSSIWANEVTTYTYDARGRLVTVSRSDGVNDGAQVAYSYDAAGNRVKVTTSGADAGSPGSGGGGSGKSDKYVVVPLNGFTVIPVR